MKLQKQLEGEGIAASAPITWTSPGREAKDVTPPPPKDATSPPSMLGVLRQLEEVQQMELWQQLRDEGVVTRSLITQTNPVRRAKDIIPVDI